MPSSNFGRNTGYSDCNFHGILSPFTQIPEWYYKLGHYCFLTDTFEFIIRYHTIRRKTIRVTESVAVKTVNKLLSVKRKKSCNFLFVSTQNK